MAGILAASSVSGIYIFYKFLGYMLSALCNAPTTISAGSSTFILGLIGTYLGFMIINWKTLAGNK
jgi:rhomboid protease GluP